MPNDPFSWHWRRHKIDFMVLDQVLGVIASISAEVVMIRLLSRLRSRKKKGPIVAGPFAAAD
jgi:hypothetical protein